MTDRKTGILLHRPKHIGCLVGKGLHGRTDQMFLCRTSCQTHDRSPGFRIPVRRAKSGEGGNHIDPGRIRCPFAVILCVRRILDHPEFISEPLDRSAGNKNRTLQRILNLSRLHPNRNRRQKPISRTDSLISRIHKQEAARSVGVLHLAFPKTALPEQGCLLVPGRPADRNPVTDHAVLCPAIDST